MMLYFFPLIGGIQVLDSGFFEGGTFGWDFRVPIVSGTPDSTNKNFAVSGFSQGRISQIPEFLTKGDMDNSIQMRWILAIKECEGNIECCDQKEDKEDCRKKDTRRAASKGKNNLNHTFIFDQLTFVFHQY